MIIVTNIKSQTKANKRQIKRIEVASIAYSPSNRELSDENSIGLPRPFGLLDREFAQRKPLNGQITKREIRAISIYSLGLRSNDIVWDIGAGTGSISIEAALIANRGRIFSVERDLNNIDLLESNIQKFGTDNIEIVRGDAPEVLRNLPMPDAVFIGGSGGRLPDILKEVMLRLKPGGNIVANFAILDHSHQFYNDLKESGFDPEMVVANISRSKEMKTGGIRLESLNPVFIISAKQKDYLVE